MRLKFIKLFEEYSKDPSVDSSEVSHTWSEIRDAIQTRLPFTIVTFADESSYLSALESHFTEADYTKQTAVFRINGESKSFPSIFFIRDRGADFSDKVKELYEKFRIQQIIVGEPGKEYAKLYFKDGTSSDLGNEIVSTLEPKEFASEDYFKIGSTCYRFIGFDN